MRTTDLDRTISAMLGDVPTLGAAAEAIEKHGNYWGAQRYRAAHEAALSLAIWCLEGDAMFMTRQQILGTYFECLDRVVRTGLSDATVPRRGFFEVVADAAEWEEIMRVWRLPHDEYEIGTVFRMEHVWGWKADGTMTEPRDVRFTIGEKMALRRVLIEANRAITIALREEEAEPRCYFVEGAERNPETGEVELQWGT